MAQPAGPSRPTLIERWVAILPVRFVWAAIIWAVLLGVALPVIAAYLDTGNLSMSLQIASTCDLSCTPAQQGWSILDQFLFFLVPVIMARQMRLTIVKAEHALSSVSSNGPAAFDSVFASTSRRLPQVLLAVFVLVLFIVFSSSQGPSSGSIFDSVTSLGSLFSLLGLGSFIWTYFASLRGLHRFGGQYLILEDPAVDATQGAKPLGSIALSLTASYFGVVAIGIVSVLLGSYSVSGGLLVGGLTILGIVMFFLPLNSIHQRMRQNKDQSLARTRSQLNELARRASASEPHDANDPATGVWKLMGARFQDEKVSAAHTWPFDTSIIGRLVVVVLSVTAALLVAVVRDLLRF